MARDLLYAQWHRHRWTKELTTGRKVKVVSFQQRRDANRRPVSLQSNSLSTAPPGPQTVSGPDDISVEMIQTLEELGVDKIANLVNNSYNTEWGNS